jgi:CheY-like chemotaxis protein/HPt (histidine-containing phosphotransfer) domain-containing protein
VVEDNVVNRKLAVHLLKRMGHQVKTATGGRQAVVAVGSARPPFDMVFMDLQMPGMSGLEAAAAVRESEKGKKRRLPLVALTAHVTGEDRDRCLSVGMDAYLAKPVRAIELFETIERLAPARSALEPSSASEQAIPVNEAALLDRMGGDRKLLRDIVRVFRADSAKRLAEIETAIRRRDRERMSRAAHTLKGSLSHLSAARAERWARELEETSLEGDRSQARKTWGRLRQEIGRVGRALARLSRVREVRKPGGAPRSSRKPRSSGGARRRRPAKR